MVIIITNYTSILVSVSPLRTTDKRSCPRLDQTNPPFGGRDGGYNTQQFVEHVTRISSHPWSRLPCGPFLSPGNLSYFRPLTTLHKPGSGHGLSANPARPCDVQCYTSMMGRYQIGCQVGIAISARGAQECNDRQNPGGTRYSPDTKILSTRLLTTASPGVTEPTLSIDPRHGQPVTGSSGTGSKLYRITSPRGSGLRRT